MYDYDNDEAFQQLPDDVQEQLKRYDKQADRLSKENPLTQEELTRYVYSANSTFMALSMLAQRQAAQIRELQTAMDLVITHLEDTHGTVEDIPVQGSGLVN